MDGYFQLNFICISAFVWGEIAQEDCKARCSCGANYGCSVSIEMGAVTESGDEDSFSSEVGLGPGGPRAG